MGSRLDLHDILLTLLNSSNVYYQPPSTVIMQYPCIKYTKTDIRSEFANNALYNRRKCYELIVIDKKPDNDVVELLLGLPYCSYVRHYIADNLNHDVLEIYY